MATSGRGSFGSRSTSSGFGFAASAGSFGRKTKKTTTTTTTTAASVPPKYKTVSTAFMGKINSFKTLFNQTKGAAKCQRPTTAILNNFANWINKGAIVQTCSTAQVAKWARTMNTNFSSRAPSTTACKNVLGKKFGKTTIKAVARTKTGSFMVVTAPTCQGRTFCFPK